MLTAKLLSPALILLCGTWTTPLPAAGPPLAATSDVSPGAEPVAASLAPEVAARTAAQLQGVMVENSAGIIIGKIGQVARASGGGLVGLVQPGDLGHWDGSGVALPLTAFSAHERHLRANTAYSPRDVATGQTSLAVHETIPQDIQLGKLAPGGELSSIGAETTPMRSFIQLDLDHDGVLTASEAQRGHVINEHWDELDGNEDGVLDRSEVSLIYGDAPPTAEEANR